MPTLFPGRNRVPRCRTSTEPDSTASPPKRFTPRRLDWLSRPLRVLPAPFLCAILGLLFGVLRNAILGAFLDVRGDVRVDIVGNALRDLLWGACFDADRGSLDDILGGLRGNSLAVGAGHDLFDHQ